MGEAEARGNQHNIVARGEKEKEKEKERQEKERGDRAIEVR